MSSPKKSKKHYDLEYKRRIVQEYLQGEITSRGPSGARRTRARPDLRWKVQLDERARDERIEEIADTEGVSLDQARKIRELEEELEATQKKLAQQVVWKSS